MTQSQGRNACNRSKPSWYSHEVQGSLHGQYHESQAVEVEQSSGSQSSYVPGVSFAKTPHSATTGNSPQFMLLLWLTLLIRLSLCSHYNSSLCWAVKCLKPGHWCSSYLPLLPPQPMTWCKMLSWAFCFHFSAGQHNCAMWPRFFIWCRK